MKRIKRKISLTTRLLKSPIGNIIARPWLDACVMYFLKNWFFPLSRLWAAARTANGDVDKFIDQVPLNQPSIRQRKKISLALFQFENKRLKAVSADQQWHDNFFADSKVTKDKLSNIEEMRLDCSTAYNMTRKLFRPLRGLVKTSVQLSPPTPEEVAERFGSDGEKLQTLFKLPSELPEVNTSQSFSATSGEDYWISFNSPSSAMNDIAYARVYEPDAVKNPPTLIFGHGICVEADNYHQILDDVSELTSMGIRVIKPEAPWHGRRLLPGYYGGEKLLSAMPSSMIEFMAAQHKEWATIINWSRKTSSGPIAIGGSSLGAQTAKSIAVKACDWPQYLRPDALFVSAHCAHIAETALDGGLSELWNLRETMKAKGWHRDLEKMWLDRLDPKALTCVKGQNIVSVIGWKDRVTPAASVSKQLDFWQVPRENRFSYNRGHFSIPLGIINDNSPLAKLSEILHNDTIMSNDRSNGCQN